MKEKIHNKKILHRFAELHLKGVKPWTIRKNDCDYQVGDLIEFEVVDNLTKEPLKITFTRTILYVFQDIDFGLNTGHVILSLDGGQPLENLVKLFSLERHTIKQIRYE